MLVVCLMAILSLYLVPSYSLKEARIIVDSGSTAIKRVTTVRPTATLPSTSSVTTERRRANDSSRHAATTVTNGHAAAVYTSTSASTVRGRRRRRKNATKSKKKRTDGKDSQFARSTSNFNVLPKSDLQVVQFYAQPLNTFDVSLKPITIAGGAGDVVDYDSAAATPVSPYQTIPQQYLSGTDMVPRPFVLRPSAPHSWSADAAKMPLKTIPIYDPFRLYKPSRQSAVKHRALMPVVAVPQPKIMPTLRPQLPPTASLASITQVPPVTVTHVYKYAFEPRVRIPFLHRDDDDEFDDIPILSAALDEHLNERAPPQRFGQPPIAYSPPATVSVADWNRYAAAVATGRLRDDPKLVAKYKERTKGVPDAADEVDESKEDKNYSDEDVRNALEYIRKLKKSSGKGKAAAAVNRGSKKFRNEKKAKKKGKRKEKEGDDFDGAGADEDDGEESRRESNKRAKGKNEDEFFAGGPDDDFDANAFLDEDKTQEESQKKIVKAERNHHAAAATPQETQIVPNVKENVEENNEQNDVILENTEIGGEDRDERVEFQMHGMKGPESYKFGYDTGKGENRQFRYEERDPDGRVKGHFGYYDREGKLQVFNYEADPEHGYHLEKVTEH